MQTAAEFWATSIAAYAAAEQALDAALADSSWTAAVEQKGTYGNLPPAVVLDLDETVLDNSPLQAQLVLDRRDYSREYWDEWVDLADGATVPGSVQFLKAAEAKGVAIFFVTNRTATEKPKTIEALVSAGITTAPHAILAVGEQGWTGDKTSRRAEIARTHRILLLIGDDLNDFVSTSKLMPEERLTLAAAQRARWGSKWIMIANPVYGSWERALYPGMTEDDEILRRKRHLVRGFKPARPHPSDR